MASASDLWLGRFTAATPLRPVGTIHPYRCQDADSGVPHVVLVGDPTADPQQVATRLDAIANAHAQLDHPMIARLAARAKVGEVQLLALECRGLVDVHTALTRLEEAGNPMPWPQFAALMSQLTNPLASAHETLDHDTGMPICMGIAAWSKFLVGPGGSLSIWGFGDVFSGRLTISNKQWQDAEIATEVARGEPASVRSDINALFRMLLPVLDRMPHTPALERILRGQPLPEDQELMAKFLDLNMRLGASTIDDRPPSMRVLLAEMEEIWRLQQITRDFESMRQSLADVVSSEVASHAIALVRRIDDGSQPPPLFWQRGRYRAKRLLGAGMNGSVHLAWDRELEQEVAIKTLHAGARASASARKRFVREVRLMRTVSHPHLVAGYDLIHEGDVLAAVMEFVAGTSLEDRLLQGRGARREIIETTCHMAQALAALHAAGVVHRDLKPANVIVHPERGPVIVDLGVASEIDSHLTAPGVLIGTPLYMAPEQLSGEPTSAATDIFALCTIMLEWLTGEHPFAAQSISHALLLRMRRPPGLDHAAVTPALRQLLTAGLAVEAAERPSAAAIVATLQAMGEATERLGKIGLWKQLGRQATDKEVQRGR